MDVVVSSSSVDESDRNKLRMLELCFRGDLEQVRCLLDDGQIDVNEADTDGTTALQIASASGHRSLVELLLEKGAEIEKANFAGMTPFLHACREGHLDVVARTLKMLEVDVNPKKSSREYSIAPSPLMVACFNMDIEMCSFLAQNNADKKFRVDHLRLNLEELAKSCGIEYMLRMLRAPDECCDSEGGGDLEGGRVEPYDIRRAIQNGDDQELIALIAQNQSTVSLVQKDGVTPLMYATVMGKLAMNVLGMTALMLAVTTEDDAMVHLLLEKGAKVGILSTTKEPFTVTDLAFHAKLGRDTLVEIYSRTLAANGGGGPIANIHEKNPCRRSRPGSALSISSRNSKKNHNASKKMIKKMIGEFGANLRLSERKPRANMLPYQQEPAMRNFDMLVVAASRTIGDGNNQQFVLADQILRGETKIPRVERITPDSYVDVARNTVLNWVYFGEALPASFSNSAMHSSCGFNEEPSSTAALSFKPVRLTPSNGHYSIAQKNAQETLKYLQTAYKGNPKRISKLSDQSPSASLNHLPTNNNLPKHLLRSGNKSSVQRRAPLRQYPIVLSEPVLLNGDHQRSASSSSLSSVQLSSGAAFPQQPAVVKTPGALATTSLTDQQLHSPVSLSQKIRQQSLLYGGSGSTPASPRW